MCFNTSIKAEIPNSLKVFTGHPTNVPLCKSIFEEYDKVYNTKSQIILKPGVSGMLAMKDMQAEKSFSIMCATGVSDHVINRYIYPGNDSSFDDLKLLSIFGISSATFITSSNSKFNYLPDMLKNGKQISVGYHSLGLKAVATQVFKNVDILWVPYKNSLEAVSSLKDGSLELYIDGAGLKPLVETGVLKSLGTINPLNNQANTDLSLVYPSASKFKLMIGFSTSNKNSISDIEEFQRRLFHLQSLDSVKSLIQLSGYKPEYISGKDAELVFHMFRAEHLK